MKKRLWSLALVLSGACAAVSTPAQAATASEQDISDASICLLGRLLVMRQQQLDFQEGFKWNEIVHRRPGEVDWPNPNLDVRPRGPSTGSRSASTGPSTASRTAPTIRRRS